MSERSILLGDEPRVKREGRDEGFGGRTGMSLSDRFAKISSAHRVVKPRANVKTVKVFVDSSQEYGMNQMRGRKQVRPRCLPQARTGTASAHARTGVG